MTGVRWRLDPRVAVVLPTIDDQQPDDAWFAAAARGLLAERGDEHAGEAAVVAAIRDAATRALGALGAHVLLWPLGVPGATVLRVATTEQPLGEEGLQAWGDTGSPSTRAHAFASQGLGDGRLELELGMHDGRSLAMARWSWVKRGGSLLAILGPIPHEALSVVLPTAAAVLDEARVEGLDVDGVPFGEQESLLPPLADVESWRAVVPAATEAEREA